LAGAGGRQRGGNGFGRDTVWSHLVVKQDLVRIPLILIGRNGLSGSAEYAGKRIAIIAILERGPGNRTVAAAAPAERGDAAWHL
jgi:hypothetical protein